MPQDLVNFFNNFEADWFMLFFLMFFSMGVAIFHTLILDGIYRIKFKPNWLFFVLNPALIGFAGLFDTRFGAVVFAFLFLSVFVLGIFGMFYAAVRSTIFDNRAKDAALIKDGKPPIPFWKKLLSGFVVIIFIFLFFTVKPAYIVVFFFIVLPFISSLKSSNKKSFYNLQRTLPTSKIRSVAMGLAEISGKVRMIKSKNSPIKNVPCIGYLYTIEDISRDKDGKESFRIVFSETICESFYVEDATGKIEVKTDEIEFLDFKVGEQYRSSGKRYREYLLLENAEVLMIGKASNKENYQPIFEYEEVKKVFAIAPVASVENWNNLRPLLKSASYYAYFFGLMIALVLISDVNLSSSNFRIGKFQLNLQNSQSDNNDLEQEAFDPDAAEYSVPVESAK
ncbi:hypothetical protein [Frigoriflavimonas asaccharolytica]|uniref:Uncharacterized protein n=1 Tax=Frigoriflavimonas asaccharolytica TaxID=2735899 RepID=A0A8J8GB38_9FLAO|nr:hypothetical protein [Frigoriflavimonas asaccharolytica]NRS93267.1 hypothetical protein [Frigoriflavimonas asaccharolytica]